MTTIAAATKIMAMGMTTIDNSVLAGLGSA
jgi:hypothetical protein